MRTFETRLNPFLLYEVTIAYVSQKAECDGLDRNSLHRFIVLNAWSLGMTLLGGVALLE